MTLDTTTNLVETDMTATRVDMHCHSTASQLSKLGVQRALGLPECASAPGSGLWSGSARGISECSSTPRTMTG
jgi:hypothetical protein